MWSLHVVAGGCGQLLSTCHHHRQAGDGGVYGHAGYDLHVRTTLPGCPAINPTCAIGDGGACQVVTRRLTTLLPSSLPLPLTLPPPLAAHPCAACLLAPLGLASAAAAVTGHVAWNAAIAGRRIASRCLAAILCRPSDRRSDRRHISARHHCRNRRLSARYHPTARRCLTASCCLAARRCLSA